jgi:hypothetical protein
MAVATEGMEEEAAAALCIAVLGPAASLITCSAVICSSSTSRSVLALQHLQVSCQLLVHSAAPASSHYQHQRTTTAASGAAEQWHLEGQHHAACKCSACCSSSVPASQRCHWECRQQPQHQLP